MYKSAAPIRRLLSNVVNMGNRATGMTRGLGTLGHEGAPLFRRMGLGPAGRSFGPSSRIPGQMGQHFRMPGGAPDQFERMGTIGGGLNRSGVDKINDSLARLKQSITRRKVVPPQAPQQPPAGPPAFPPNPHNVPAPPMGQNMAPFPSTPAPSRIHLQAGPPGPPAPPYPQGNPYDPYAAHYAQGPGMFKSGSFKGVLTKVAAGVSPLGAMPMQNSAAPSPLARAAAAPPTSPAAGAQAVGQLTSAADMVGGAAAPAPQAPAATPPGTSALSPQPAPAAQ